MLEPEREPTGELPPEAEARPSCSMRFSVSASAVGEAVPTGIAIGSAALEMAICRFSLRGVLGAEAHGEKLAVVRGVTETMEELAWWPCIECISASSRSSRRSRPSRSSRPPIELPTRGEPRAGEPRAGEPRAGGEGAARSNTIKLPLTIRECRFDRERPGVLLPLPSSMLTALPQRAGSDVPRPSSP